MSAISVPPSRTVRSATAVLLASALVALVGSTVPMEAAVGFAPGHLDILSAQIIEQPPLDPWAVAGRGLVLRLVVDEPPLCDAGTGHLLYGFLVDADHDPSTGSGLPDFMPLGVDARLTAVCDPATGAFTSPLGPVSVWTDAATNDTTIEIATTVARLPAVDFSWIAVAQEHMLMYRLPPAPAAGRWAIQERWIW